MQNDPLWLGIKLLAIRWRRFGLAVLLGTGALGSAIALSGVSAWLIARAGQHPPVMTLSIAAVMVRMFGISRGVLRYLERLVSHDIALRGMNTLRESLYAILAHTDTTRLYRLQRGEVLARIGGDIDGVGDAVVRGLLPIAVAGGVGLLTVIGVGYFSPAAAAALALCLVLAGTLSPWLTARASRLAAQATATDRGALSATVFSSLSDAAATRVSGIGMELRGQVLRLDRSIDSHTDRLAGPPALATALVNGLTGLAMLAAFLLGMAEVSAGALAPVELAIITLVPLAAFEPLTPLPAAAVQLTQSRLAAARILELLNLKDAGSRPLLPLPDENITAERVQTVPREDGPLLTVQDLAVSWSGPGSPPLNEPLSFALEPGGVVSVVGRSGVGKTTALLTITGQLIPASGQVLYRGVGPSALTESQRQQAFALITEDSHVFATTVLENLRVARGTVTEDEATEVLAKVGLSDWLAQLPHGLDTELGPGGTTVSGGERRRLLLGRALVSAGDVVVLDEPTEHLSASDAPGLIGTVLAELRSTGRAVIMVTHHPQHLPPGIKTLELQPSPQVPH